MPSFRRLCLPIAAFAFVALLAFFYHRYFEISPPDDQQVQPLKRDENAQPNVDELGRIFPELSQLFPDPDDWRRQSPNVIFPSDRSVVFFFQNEPTVSPDRAQLTLSACTVVFLAAEPNLSVAERCRQALVFESNDRVVLSFTKPLDDLGDLDNTKFDFSSFQSGEMKGKVILRSDMKSPTAEDDLYFQTRDLVFTEKQIRTNFEFSFNFGRNAASGRGLTIDLDMPFNFSARDAAKTAAQKSDDDPDADFRARLAALTQAGNLGCGYSIEQIELTELDGYARFYLDESFGTAPVSQDADKAPYIDVRCKKGVYFSSNPESFGGWCVRFNDSVEVVSYRDGAKAEHLLCDALYLYFQDPELEKLAAERPDYRQLLDRAAPTGSLARLVPTLLRAQRSQDEQAIVRVQTAQNNQVEIASDEIQYDVRKYVLKLFSNEENGKPATLNAQSPARVDFSANAVQIQLDENHKPQTIVASGNGKLVAYSRDADGVERQIRADWQNGLRVAPEPNQPNQYKLSTQGAVAFYFDDVGTFSAREADFWMQTVAPKAQPADAPLETASKARPAANLFANVVPIAAAFRNDVVFQGKSGNARISDAVVIRFSSDPQTNDDASTVAVVADEADDDSPVDSRSVGKSTLGLPDDSTFEINARNLDLWCLFASSPGKKVVIERATFRGDVTLVETGVDGTQRMRVVAKEAELVAPTTDEARVLLVGDATTVASFQMRELALSGYHVVVDRAANAFEVLGPGKLKALPPADAAAKAEKSPQSSGLFTAEPVEIAWTEAMKFNGQTLAFYGSEKHDLLISQRTQTLSCREARFTLTRPISLFDLDSQTLKNLDVATIEFLGDFDRPIQINATSFGSKDATAKNANDDEKFYQAFLHNLRYDRAAERFVATGGGTLLATSLGSVVQLDLLGDASNADAPAETWTTVSLKFKNEITGDLANGEIAATGGVRAVACNASHPLFKLDVDAPATHPKKATRIAGDEARVVLVDSPSDASKKSFEIDMRRNVVFHCEKVFGRCDALKYVAEKNLAILSGDGSNKAALYRQEYAGAPRETLGEFSRALYHLDTKRLEVESISASGVDD